MDLFPVGSALANPDLDPIHQAQAAIIISDVVRDISKDM